MTTLRAVKNQSLGKARTVKQDEFYTQLGDISNELKHYKAQLRGKTIFCNCDDPYESNFFKYFALNFNALGLQKLIATSYTKSPVAGADLSLFSIEGLKPEGEEPYAIEINAVPDQNCDGAIDLADVEYLLTNNEKTLSLRAFDEKTRVKRYEQQQGICPVCQQKYSIGDMEADHIIPWSQGGKTVLDNCQMLCKKDNRTKSGK